MTQPSRDTQLLRMVLQCSRHRYACGRYQQRYRAARCLYTLWCQLCVLAEAQTGIHGSHRTCSQLRKPANGAGQLNFLLVDNCHSKAVSIEGLPAYQELSDLGVGAFLSE